MGDTGRLTRNQAWTLDRLCGEWDAQPDPWLFGYGSLIWKPEFQFEERRLAKVHGWHRTLSVWSRIDRGTPDRLGLVFGVLPGGSCQGMVFRVARKFSGEVLRQLWSREMKTSAYQPKWLKCETREGRVRALAFTLSRNSPAHAAHLTGDDYRRIFREARGCSGSTLDYARQTFEELRRHSIRDRALERLLAHFEREG